MLFFFEQNREFLQKRDLRFREQALTFVHKCRSGRFGLLFVMLKNAQDSRQAPCLTRGRGGGGVRVEMSLLETESLHAGTVFAVLGFSKLNITLMSYGKREFVPRDQVSFLLVVYSSLF